MKADSVANAVIFWTALGHEAGDGCTTIVPSSVRSEAWDIVHAPKPKVT